MRGSWPALTVMLLVGGGLAILAAGESPAVAYVVYSGWAVLIVALVVRGLVAAAQRRPIGPAEAPAWSAVDTWESLYLGRKDLGPVRYGDPTPPVAGLSVTDRDPFERSLPDRPWTPADSTERQ